LHLSCSTFAAAAAAESASSHSSLSSFLYIFFQHLIK
jgi:hypothetical protein